MPKPELILDDENGTRVTLRCGQLRIDITSEADCVHMAAFEDGGLVAEFVVPHPTEAA